MASSSTCSSIASTNGCSLFYPKPFSELPSPSLLSFSRTLRPSHFTSTKTHSLKRRNNTTALKTTTVKAQSLGFGGSFFEDDRRSQDGSGSGSGSGGGIGLEDESLSLPGWGMMPVEEKETPPCPPGLRQYETMAVLRPDMSEEERLALTQKYEEVLVAGGGMYVEVFNRGIIPLSYSIKKRDKDGVSNTYMDGIYLLFKYFTKPESIETLDTTLRTDDNVIRSTSFKVRKKEF